MNDLEKAKLPGDYQRLDPDMVKVVRCKDCAFKSSWYKHASLGFDICGASGMFIVEDIDFCSYGERKAE